jgi:hypothetical protein
MRTRIMYVELKTGHNDNGPAWIGRVGFSKTGQTIYYREKSLRRIHGGRCRATIAMSRPARSTGSRASSATKRTDIGLGPALSRSTPTLKTNTAE